jgi:type II secretory pathway component PulK
MRRRRPRAARGSVIIIVLWAIAIATLVTSSIQLVAYRQATVGHEALDRVRARWAARAGLENTIAVMADHTENPLPGDAFAMIRDLEYVAYGQLNAAEYDIIHHVDGQNWLGPMDEHSRLNVNSSSRNYLMLLDDMTFDVADSISDWIDEDDDVGYFGAERDYYLSLETPYEPRNTTMRTTAELELVAGIWPETFRGEDWNLNNRLDPNEDDGALTWPDDEPDGILEGGWASKLTAYSVDGGATASGLPRIRLGTATAVELEERLGVEPAQAGQLIAFGRSGNSRMEQLLSTSLSTLGNQRTSQAGLTTDLTEEQLANVLAECRVHRLTERPPGRLNINTVSAEFLRDLLEVLGLDEVIADEILYLRDSRAEGIGSLVDLRTIRELTAQNLEVLGRLFTTTSNVYTVTVRGRSNASGVGVEIIAVVDRSTVPVTILEYREQ